MGVTSSCLGLTKLQEQWIANFLNENTAYVLHHGDCVGGDDEVAHLFAEYGTYIIAHPGNSMTHRAYSTANDLILPSMDNLRRNRVIVTHSEFMLALPGTAFEIMRSGTWHTIRYAKNQKVPLVVIKPNGQVSV